MGSNEITIDTNVFEHLFNPQNNEGGHIDNLLSGLVRQRVTLCADAGGRIIGEYDQQLRPFFRKSDEDQKLIWLRYFLIYADKLEIEVGFGDPLMVSIKGKIPFAEPSDRIFVYVAISADSVLISNDLSHITDHRNNLRRCARKHGSSSTDFVDSITAHSLMAEVS